MLEASKYHLLAIQVIRGHEGGNPSLNGKTLPHGSIVPLKSLFCTIGYPNLDIVEVLAIGKKNGKLSRVNRSFPKNFIVRVFEGFVHDG